VERERVERVREMVQARERGKGVERVVEEAGKVGAWVGMQHEVEQIGYV
jgi:hypothetical protein